LPSDLYDPYDHDLQVDPYPVYRELRDAHPVYRNESRGFWAISRFADVWDIVHDPARFSSAQGVTLDTADADPSRPTILTLDPPRHDQLRAIVSRAFTPRRIAELEPSIRTLAVELAEAGCDAGRFDLVRDLAAPLPTIVIADLLGVDRADREQFRHWSDQMIQRDPGSPASQAAAREGARSLYRYFADVVADRRTRHRDDLVTALLDAEVDGVHLTDNEILAFCLLLLVAGNETTTNLISNTAVLLAEQPDQRRLLVEKPELLPGAIEELLRFESPVQALARTATVDVELHGERIAAGDKVLLLFGSANRDEREFVAADRFDVTRAPGRHLAFGHGAHFCLGASLARLEARVAYEELLRLMPAYELAGDPERLPSGVVRGLLSVPVDARCTGTGPS